jgi:hypothetical protein
MANDFQCFLAESSAQYATYLAGEYACADCAFGDSVQAGRSASHRA